MVDYPMIISYFICVLIASLFGLIEAILYGRLGNKSLGGKDEHRWLYVPLRFLIFCLAFSFRFIGLEECFLIFVCALSLFPFFHDGFYYLGRKWIDGAYNGFMDMTTGSSAKISLEPVTRFMLFICSIMLLLIGCLK